jgi:hypothetical protein
MNNSEDIYLGNVGVEALDSTEYRMLDQLYSATQARDRLNDAISLRYLSTNTSSYAAVAPVVVHNDYQSLVLCFSLAAESLSRDVMRAYIGDAGHVISGFSVDPYDAFDALAARLENDTATMSSPTQILESPYVREFKNMGRRSEVIDRMLSRMEKFPIAWMVVLSDLTGVNPISQKHRGHVKKMLADWRRWGSSHNLTN